jgi:hypothetical protein
MQAVRPLVAVITDGGGHGNQSRLHLSRDLCHAAKAPVSRCFGMVTDAAMYRAILDQDFPFFRGLADDLASVLVAKGIDCVAGDAHEGYNPTHDLCRAIVNRAVRAASAHQAIDNYEFGLAGSPIPDAPGADWLRLDLDEGELARKLEVSRGYAAAVGGTLLSEVDDLIARCGEAAFAHEYLVPVDAWAAREPIAPERPFYETYGERQVAAGHYAFVIRQDDHMTPIARALQE